MHARGIRNLPVSLTCAATVVQGCSEVDVPSYSEDGWNAHVISLYQARKFVIHTIDMLAYAGLAREWQWLLTRTVCALC